MNEQANEVLSQMMQKALDGVDAAVEFSQAQIPDVVEQLLMWHAVESLLKTFLGIAFLGALWILCRWAYKDIKKPQEEVEERYSVWKYKQGTVFKTRDGDLEPMLSVMLLPIILLPPIGLALIDLTWLKIWIAPKLYLLEYAASLIK